MNTPHNSKATSASGLWTIRIKPQQTLKVIPMSRRLKPQTVAIMTVFVLCGMSSAWSEEPYVVPLKYPGPEVYVIRTIHNPYGNGSGVVVVGGSDLVGINRGAEALADVLSQASAGDSQLSIGWTMETQLGKGVTPPTDIKQFKTWQVSRGYGSIGYFGWCSIRI